MNDRPPDRRRPRLTVIRDRIRRLADQARPAPPAGSSFAVLRERGLLPSQPPEASTGSAQEVRNERIVVGVNALATARGAGVLITYGLGSCIAVILLDPNSRVGAMCHYMLPDSTQDPRRSASQPLMFGDMAIAQLAEVFTRRGGDPRNAEAYVVGGASLSGMGDLFDIGGRNARMARVTLERLRYHVRGHEVGDRTSRTASLDLNTGAIVVATPGLAPRRLR
ncbi:MAG: hypothetical protein CVU56_04260 [Deltaproteobacteria bacterium HGW-Deltaproteobacteria-14]|jgi:chemotaxis protein CheD|nr:MAG: hypothetical protein CVU56_04260 [Deltaproteobacteria bacterium HGW-Deltaproteobacteria-14]